ncbi:MAG: SPOR domain-containing protein, partial [Pontixanthobacter sp.]
IQSTTVAPSIAAAQIAVAEASRVTGTESPAEAGADYTRSSPAPVSTPTRNPSPAVKVVTNSAPVAATAAATPAASPAAQSGAGGAWRVQLGAFSVRSNADKLWARIADNSAIAGKQKFIIPVGRVVKLQAGGYPSQSSAQTACNTLKRSGQDCIVARQ